MQSVGCPLALGQWIFQSNRRANLAEIELVLFELVREQDEEVGDGADDDDGEEERAENDETRRDGPTQLGTVGRRAADGPRRRGREADVRRVAVDRTHSSSALLTTGAPSRRHCAPASGRSRRRLQLYSLNARESSSHQATAARQSRNGELCQRIRQRWASELT